ncbi:MAG: hypothetical protein WEB59_16285 [Thermoanaerobaculia bacterium]
MSAANPVSGGARWALLAPAAAFATLVVLLYADPLVTGRNFGGRDMIAYNIPLEKSVHDAWARGRLPVWTPEVSGGRPLAPNPNAGALYPVRALFSRLPLPVALRLFPVAHWIAAGIGMLMLLAALGRSRPAAWIGAVTYVFSGVAVGEAFFPHIQPGMTLLPWIVWAAGRRTGTRWSRLLLLSCLFALDFLAADVFTIALALACAALWLAVEEDRREQLRAAGALGLAVCLGALAAAPQLLATALWIPQTNRAVLGMKLAEVFLFSIHPLRLVELVVPYPFGATWELAAQAMWAAPVHHGKVMGLFPTLYAGAFAVIAVGVAWKSRERGARFARILLLGALVASVLPSLLPASWAGLSSPLALRNPEKLAVAIVFSLAILAGLGFDAWRGRPRKLAGLIGVGALFAALSVSTALFPEATGRLAVRAVGADPTRVPIAARSLPFAFAEAGLLWMGTVIALDALGGARRRGVALAVILLTLVPVAANRKIARTFREGDVFGPTAFARYVTRRDPEGAYRTLGESFFQGVSQLEFRQNSGALADAEFSRRSWYQHTPVLWNRGMVFNEDFDSGDLSSVESLRKIAGMAIGYRDSANFFGTVGLRFGIRFRDHEAVAGYRPVGGDALQIWDEHVRAFPDIRLLERWREVPGPLQALSTISQLDEGEIAIESGAASSGWARPGAVRIIEKSPERMVADLDAPDPTWLFVLRAYWPHRTILLDGRPVEAQPAQLAFSAVPIPPGRHRLVWQERLPGLRVSVWGTALFGMIAAVLAVVHERRRNR